MNYAKAFDFVSEYLDSKRPITQGMIREIHSRLVEGVRGNQATPGKYRAIQNYVVNSQTKEVIYTPPPAYEVPRLMTDLIVWLQEETTIPPVLVAGIAQSQFVDIHPFSRREWPDGSPARFALPLPSWRKRSGPTDAPDSRGPPI